MGTAQPSPVRAAHITSLMPMDFSLMPQMKVIGLGWQMNPAQLGRTRLIPPIPGCARGLFAHTDPKTHPEIPSLSCSSVQTRWSLPDQEFFLLHRHFSLHTSLLKPCP